jgi:hypothetical protein
MLVQRRSDVVPRSEAVVRFEASDVIEVAFRDRVTSGQVDQAIERTCDLLRNRTARLFLIDTLETTGYEPSVRGPGVALLKAMKQYGVVAGAAVASSGTVRMIGAAVAFVAGLQVEFVPTRDEALKKLDLFRRDLP